MTRPIGFFEGRVIVRGSPKEEAWRQEKLQAELDGSGAPLHVAGRIRLDAWQGRRTVALHVEDAARA